MLPICGEAVPTLPLRIAEPYVITVIARVRVRERPDNPDWTGRTVAKIPATPSWSAGSQLSHCEGNTAVMASQAGSTGNAVPETGRGYYIMDEPTRATPSWPRSHGFHTRTNCRPKGPVALHALVTLGQPESMLSAASVQSDADVLHPAMPSMGLTRRNTIGPTPEIRVAEVQMLNARLQCRAPNIFIGRLNLHHFLALGEPSRVRGVLPSTTPRSQMRAAKLERTRTST
ncbi:hypothetical protein F4780DRAFT_491732 [Xylariomycetidae sp. FL0641]|nr:hypothetical protein F4780DRAFT_491732 [Xylariomycetidae sp. FL0641]